MKIIDTFQNRLKKIMDIRNIKQVDLVEKTKIDKTLINKYLSGITNAGQKKLTILADALDVNEIWLMGYDVPMNRKINENDKLENIDINLEKYYWCPVYGKISAGEPNWAEECMEGKLPIDPELMGIINPEEHYFLRVNGESMNKIIKNGAFALIHKQDYVDNGEIAVVLVNGDCATLKRFSKQGNIIVLTPESTDDSFQQQIYTENTPIKVIGKYVGKMEINK